MQEVRGVIRGVYFIRCEDFVKVGKSTNVESRLKTMQTGCPYNLHLIHVRIPDAYSSGVLYREEQRLHRRYESIRARGEWFNLSGPLLHDLAAWGGETSTYDTLENRQRAQRGGICIASVVAAGLMPTYDM